MPTSAGPGRPRSSTWLVAPDSFKGTFTAEQVAAALAHGLTEAGSQVDVCPLGDGGEGTMSVLLTALGGSPVPAPVHDPLGRELEASFALLADGSTAVVETAAASGLHTVAESERDAEAASSAGTGELILAAIAAGARRVLVAVGGSATSDGGQGAIEAIEAGGGLRGATVELLCDTLAPFESAATVFGPQKGADEAAVQRLSARLERQARRLPRDPSGVPMTGGAGGLAGGLWAYFGAQLRSGADVVLDAVDFDHRAARVDAVVTGEGRLDGQSGEGKLVSVVAKRGTAAGAAVHAVAGEVALEAAEIARLGLDSAREAGSEAAIEAAGFRLGSL